MTMHGPWKIVASREIYEDPWLALRKDDVLRPDGSPGTYSVVRLKAGACVLAMDDSDFVYLTEEFHYAVGRVTLEAVSGGVEPGEEPIETGRRELREELGITAAEWADLGRIDPFTGSVLSPTQLFLARGLAFGQSSPDSTETIQMARMPFREAVRKVMEGEITHAPSAVLILKALALRERWAAD